MGAHFHVKVSHCHLVQASLAVVKMDNDHDVGVVETDPVVVVVVAAAHENDHAHWRG